MCNRVDFFYKLAHTCSDLLHRSHTSTNRTLYLVLGEMNVSQSVFFLSASLCRPPISLNQPTHRVARSTQGFTNLHTNWTLFDTKPIFFCTSSLHWLHADVSLLLTDFSSCSVLMNLCTLLKNVRFGTYIVLLPDLDDVAAYLTIHQRQKQIKYVYTKC